MDDLGRQGPAVDIAGAAEISGLSKKALRRRVERGTIPAITRNGRRLIPVAELRRQGLVGAGSGQVPQANPAGVPRFDLELLDRLERQAAELGRYRALTERAESLERQAVSERQARAAAEAEVHRLRAELQTAKRRWWRR